MSLPAGATPRERARARARGLAFRAFVEVERQLSIGAGRPRPLRAHARLFGFAAGALARDFVDMLDDEQVVAFLAYPFAPAGSKLEGSA